jgi:hypothetical protein
MGCREADGIWGRSRATLKVEGWDHCSRLANLGSCGRWFSTKINVQKQQTYQVSISSREQPEPGARAVQQGIAKELQSQDVLTRTGAVMFAGPAC